MKKNLPLGKLPEHKGVQICLFIFHFVNELVISTILIKTTRCDSLLTRPDDQISFHGVGILAVGIVLRLNLADPKKSQTLFAWILKHLRKYWSKMPENGTDTGLIPKNYKNLMIVAQSSKYKPFDLHFLFGGGLVERINLITPLL